MPLEETKANDNQHFGSYEDFVRFITESDIEDVLILRRDTVRKVFTPKRREILETVRNDEIDSIRDLARKLDREVSAVHGDLEVLYEADIITFEEESGSKIPQLKHSNIIPEPLVYRETR